MEVGEINCAVDTWEGFAEEVMFLLDLEECISLLTPKPPLKKKKER